MEITMKITNDLFNGFAICISLLLLILIPTVSFAATYCVSNATEFQTALTTAASNGSDDTIQIVQGTYSGNFTYASTETNSLIIEGGYTEDCTSRTIDPENTVLDGGGVDNVLMLVTDDLAADFSVEGLTIQNGSSLKVSNGGGLYVKTAAELTLSKSIFIGNSATSGDGGGVYVSVHGSGTFTDNTFTGNSAALLGGGVRVHGSGTFTDNTFTENSAGSGGGGVGGSGTFTDNTFTGNSADNDGGGVYGGGTFTNNTFTENSAGSGGGGVRVYGSGTFTNNTFTENSAGSGGGVYGEGTFTNNTFTENSATSRDGGGVYSPSSTFTDNTFTGNTASGRGGGVYVSSSSSTFTDNTFTENSAQNGGGGVYSSSSSTFTDNTFTGNTASGDGGGVYVSSSSSTFTDNTFTENSAQNGGGVYGGGSSSLINCTITGNTASSQGGGIAFTLAKHEYAAKIYNNIIWNNTAPEAADVYIDNTGDDPFFPAPVELFNNDFDQSSSGTVIVKPFAIDSSNLNNVAPLFTGTNNFHLSASSPCVNTGDNAAPSIPTTDKDGNPRISGGTVDMGAYEYNPSAPVANAGSDQTVNVGDTVTLDGSSSSDPGNQSLTYLWTQTGGSLVTLSDATAVQPTFTAPAVPGGLIFQLAVTNTDGLKNTDNVGVDITAVIPTVTTTTVSSITSTGATSGGNVTSDGGDSITAKGVCWSTSSNPTTGDNHTNDGTGTGSFTSSITGLSPGTTYHVRAYATNSAGTSYGNDESFTTSITTPTVTTTAASSLTLTSASSGGNVTSDGGGSVTAKGVCWSTSTPTVSDSKTTDGDGTGSFTSSITGLSPGTTYHVRAYATNIAGTAYGNDVTFTTSYSSARYVNSDGYCGGKIPCHRTIQAAIEVASTGEAILIANGTYDEDITLNANKSLTLRGGWDSTFTNQTSNTTFIKAPKAPLGSLTLQMLTIKP